MTFPTFQAAADLAETFQANHPEYRVRVRSCGGYLNGSPRAFVIQYMGADVKWWRRMEAA